MPITVTLTDEEAKVLDKLCRQERQTLLASAASNMTYSVDALQYRADANRLLDLVAKLKPKERPCPSLRP